LTPEVEVEEGKSLVDEKIVVDKTVLLGLEEISPEDDNSIVDVEGNGSVEDWIDIANVEEINWLVDDGNCVESWFVVVAKGVWPVDDTIAELDLMIEFEAMFGSAELSTILEAEADFSSIEDEWIVFWVNIVVACAEVYVLATWWVVLDFGTTREAVAPFSFVIEASGDTDVKVMVFESVFVNATSLVAGISVAKVYVFLSNM
jgi:hypothetical protein